MATEQKKLFLLDAMALIYRAHFAFSKNPRINSKGLNTGAILGFTNSLVEILNKEKPSHIAVAFDTHAPTFRHLEYKEYKAQREEQPEDIRTAIPLVKDITRAFQIPVLELDGFEADDIIGTISKKASKEGFEVYMMTPDKDYAQLVEEKIFLYKPAYMGNAVDVLGVPEVLKKFEIEHPDQVRDILGLQGDSSDNIPGIPGVGAKTAIKLLQEYGSVEGILENSHALKGKQKENVEKFADQARLSKHLATIKIDVPLSFEWEDLKYKGPDEEALKKLFDELEFRTLMKRVLGENVAPSQKKASSGQMDLFSDLAEEVPLPEMAIEVSDKKTIHTAFHRYHLIQSPEQRKELIEYLLKQREFCFDTETTAIQAYEAELVGLSFCYHAGEAYYVPIPEDQEEAKKVVGGFKEVFEHPEILKIAQNIKFDQMVLRHYGIRVSAPTYDTMLAHYLIDPDTRHNMDVMAENYLNYSPVSIETLIGKKGKKQGSMRDVPLEEIKEYASEDADITLQLKHKLDEALQDERMKKLLLEVELPLVDVLAEMEWNGVSIDKEALAELSAELERDSLKKQEEIFEQAGQEFNIASPKQLGEILFDKMNIMDKPKKTKTGQYATGEDILSRLAHEHPIASSILDFRELQKLKSTYVDALPDLISPRDGRIHTSYNQAVAATGRLSSTQPNLQNIPIRTEKGREIRKAFVPQNDDYVIMAADYSQIELRIMASFSKDEGMIEAFQNGLDIHSATAAKIFKVPLGEVSSDMRRKAKTANFGIIYGISAFGLGQRLNIPRKEAGEIIDSYFQEFPAVKKYMDEVINHAREKEYVETLLGRRRYLRDINSKNMTVRGFAERNAINAPIQGSAADMIKLAMIKVHQWMQQKGLRSKMIMQVHDELVFEVHKDELDLMKKNISEGMRDALALEVPIVVEIGTGENWLVAH